MFVRIFQHFGPKGLKDEITTGKLKPIWSHLTIGAKIPFPWWTLANGFGMVIVMVVLMIDCRSGFGDGGGDGDYGPIFFFYYSNDIS